MVMMRARTVTGALGLNGALLKFFALKVDAANVVLLGVPELWLSANNLEVRVNQGSFTPGVWPGGLTGPPPVVDFVLSFGSGGYSVPTGGAPVPIDYTGPVVGASADNVLFRVSDFVYVSGGFSFDKGATQYVDVQTNLGVLTTIQKDALFGNMQVSGTDPGGTTLARSDDGSIIWNLPVQTIDFGLHAVSVFVGYTDSLDAAALDGNLTRSDLEAANAVGLFLENVSLGMVLMRAMPVTSSPLPPTGLNASLLKFFALKVQASTVALLGVPELTLSTTNLEIRVNQGSFTPARLARPAGSPRPAGRRLRTQLPRRHLRADRRPAGRIPRPHEHVGRLRRPDLLRSRRRGLRRQGAAADLGLRLRRRRLQLQQGPRRVR